MSGDEDYQVRRKCPSARGECCASRGEVGEIARPLIVEASPCARPYDIESPYRYSRLLRENRPNTSGVGRWLAFVRHTSMTVLLSANVGAPNSTQSDT